MLASGCVAGDGVTDAAVPGTDGNAGDGSPGDAGPCGEKLLFTGEYIDWDSTPSSLRGVFDARVSEADNPENAVRTAPNGRATLCVPAGARSVVTFVHEDYLPVRYTVEPAAVQGPFSARGLTPARADELFVTELGVGRDPAAAQVMIAVRTYPDDAPAAGATVAIGNFSSGAFTDEGGGFYEPGDTLAGNAFVLFANVDVAGGRTTVSVTAPAGMRCTGPDTVDLAAGELAVTTFACSR